jgi:DNA ligase (NAD+)
MALTRGDGTTGEDITRNVELMKVPLVIPDKASGWVRGEIVITNDDFFRYFKGDSNPRNSASGTAKRHNGAKCQYLSVVAFEYVADTRRTLKHSRACRTKSGELELLKEFGFEIPRYDCPSNVQAIQDIYEAYIDGIRSSRPCEIDGLVLVVNDKQERDHVGWSNHRPKGAIAYKFPHEAKTTTLQDIRWQVGPTGRVTPVAVFDAVDLAGASVKQASLHNVSNIGRICIGQATLSLRKGDTLLVSRRNDVIPYVEEMVSSNGGEILDTPTACPDCGCGLGMVGEYLTCSNEGGCSAQTLGSIKRWLGKVGVLHFGDALVRAVVDAGMVANIADLYLLDETKVAALQMEGRRVGGAGKRALDSLNSKKLLSLDTFVGSLGIHLCGRKMIRILMEEGDLRDLNELAKASPDRLSAVPGFGGVKAAAFREGFDSRKDLMIKILTTGVKIEEYVPKEDVQGPLCGTSVCFTGVRDKTLEEAIVEAGGEIKGGVSKTLTILVAKDPNSNSGKAKKARAQGTQVLSLQDMWGRVQGVQDLVG